MTGRDLMPTLATRLQDGMAELGLVATPAVLGALQQFLFLIQKWNRVYNLTAISDPDEMVTTHILDSLAICRHLPVGPLLDVGSGAGLPGIPLAITIPAFSVTSVDAVEKKIAFQRQAAAELGLTNVSPVHGRIEALAGALPAFPAIVARAFASLADFTLQTGALLAPGGRWYAMKGARPDAEVAGLPDSVTPIAIHSLHVPGLDAERHLVVLEKAI